MGGGYLEMMSGNSSSLAIPGLVRARVQRSDAPQNPNHHLKRKLVRLAKGPFWSSFHFTVSYNGVITYEWGMQSNSRLDVNKCMDVSTKPTLSLAFNIWKHSIYPSKNMYRLCKNLGIESFFAESRIDAATAPEEPDPFLPVANLTIANSHFIMRRRRFEP
jgi:hypothetical protein